MPALVKVAQENLMTLRSQKLHWTLQVQRCAKFIKVYRLHTPVTWREQNTWHRQSQVLVGKLLLDILFKASLPTSYALHLFLDTVFRENDILLRNQRPL